MICASEDVGNADPQAFSVAVAVRTGSGTDRNAGSKIILAQAVHYVACAPKSNAAYMVFSRWIESVKIIRRAVPDHLRDAHYKGAAKNLDMELDINMRMIIQIIM